MMPTYQYRCLKCGHQFEQEQAITEEPLKRCPQCRGKIERVITGGEGFLFKGGSPTPTFARENANGSACCGLSDPCSDPKRCCGR
jgi:putative FmdB family regulatory protein